MNHEIPSSLPISFQEFSEGTWALTVVCRHNELSPLILGLNLLSGSYVEGVTYYSTSTSAKIKISIDNDEQSAVEQLDQNLFHLRLIHCDLEFWLDFLLRYYRDYQASVSHIDIELGSRTIQGGSGTLMIKATEFAEPMTSEEARKELFGS